MMSQDDPKDPSSTDDTAEPVQQWPRSYLRRQGHITRGQKRAIARLWPQFGLTFKYGQTLDLEAAFGNDHPVTLEIGFGKGDVLAHMASQAPQRNFLGIEVHRPGVGALLGHVERLGLTNVRVLRGDAMIVLAEHLRGRPLDQTCIFFPDPWHRTKDHKRRIVRPQILSLLAERTRPGGQLHLATDVQDYARHMQEALHDSPHWQPQGQDGRVPRPSWRPMSLYEHKGLDEGRAVFNLRATLQEMPE